MDVQITWTGPDGEGEWTGNLPVVLGREGDLQISDSEVSRRHAQLAAEDGRLVLTDLGSANGTFVDDERIERADLGASGAFRLGRTDFEADVRPPLAPEAGTVLIDEDQTVRAVPPEPEAPASPRIVVAWVNAETGASGEVLVQPPAVIGSREGADICLEDRRVSRSHATLDLDASGDAPGITLRDDGSSNGTFVGGERIETTTLGASGEVEIRPYRLTVSVESVGSRARVRHDQRASGSLPSLWRRRAPRRKRPRRWPRQRPRRSRSRATRAPRATSTRTPRSFWTRSRPSLSPSFGTSPPPSSTSRSFL